MKLKDKNKLIDLLKIASNEIIATARSKGWYDKGIPPDVEKIALMHSELSEALDWLRTPLGIATPSDHLFHYSGVEEELADVIIRVLDFGIARDLDIGGALIAKMEFNTKRKHRHGGRRF